MGHWGTRGAGLAAILLGILAFQYGNTGVAEYQTLQGQLARSISQDHRDMYLMYRLLRIGGGFFVFSGILAFLFPSSAEDDNPHSSSHRKQKRRHKRKQWHTQSLSAGQSCPSCGVTLNQTDKYCHECGTKVSTSGKGGGSILTFTPQKPRASQVSGPQVNCTECRAPNPEEQVHCSACGAKLHIQQST